MDDATRNRIADEVQKGKKHTCPPHQGSKKTEGNIIRCGNCNAIVGFVRLPGKDSVLG